MNLSVRDIAEISGVSEDQVTRWIRRDRLPAMVVGGEIQCHLVELLEWSTKRRVELAETPFRESLNHGWKQVSLGAALQAGGILERTTDADAESIVAEVVAALNLPTEADRRLLRDVLLSREDLGLCPAGDGIGVPHPRFPVIVPRTQPALTLAYLRSPLRIADGDAEIDKLFVLVSPTVHIHLYLVAQLAGAIRNVEFREQVLRRGAPDHVFRAAHRLNQVASQDEGS